MHLHIVGIGGTFMAALARLAQEAGHRVTGCDQAVYPPMSDQLAAAGIDCIAGYGAEQLSLRPDLWVVGNVATRGMPLIEALLCAGLPMVSGPEWIGRHVLAGRRTLAVAGTHGKTTTSSMLAHVLEQAGLAPGFLIGGVPADFGVGSRLGGTAAGSWFVIEADEYDTAFFDKRSKFLHYFPRLAVLNNLEYDHADIFPDLAAIERQFQHLLRCIPADGRIIAPQGDEALERVIAAGCWTPVERFDAPAGWHARSIVEQGESHSFDVCLGERVLGRLDLPLAGSHSRRNALAAIAAAQFAGVAPELSIHALAGFSGVLRRLQSVGTAAGVAVFDDFAHHPTAIATTLAGLRRRIGAGRLVAVVEMRSQSMRRGAFADRLAGSLAEADQVYCLAPAGWDAAAALAPLGAKAVVCGDVESLVASVAAAARAGDTVLAMSNGAFGGFPLRLLAALRQGAVQSAKAVGLMTDSER